MEETVIVIMLRDKTTGFLEKELASCALTAHDELILNAYAEEIGDEIQVVLRLTCGRDVSDWEFDAIFDYYDETIYEGEGVSFRETEDCFNPTWELSFVYDDLLLEQKVNRLIELHAAEITDVYAVVADKASDYAGN